MLRCRLLSIYYTIRYGLPHLIKTGHYLMGHQFEYTGKVHYDHWEMKCKYCQTDACTDVGPQAVENLQEI